MAQPHPNVPGHAKTAKSALLILEEKLHESDILSFPWPQDVDSGIDMVSFASIPDGDATLATAFVAGFQSKGTAATHGKLPASRVEIGNHAAYWLSAPLPVFVVSTSLADRVSLVEDVLPGLRDAAQSEHRSIAVRAAVEEVSADIRMRMYSHALAPWMSHSLRNRSLAVIPQSSGLDQASPWSVLGWVMSTDSALQPKSWTECVQYFDLLRWVLRGSDDRRQLAVDAKHAPTGQETAHLFSVLLHCIETLADFNRNRRSMPHEGAHLDDIPRAKEVVWGLWHATRQATGLDLVELAELVRAGSAALSTSDVPGHRERWPAEYLLQRLIDGDALQDLMTRALEAALIEKKTDSY